MSASVTTPVAFKQAFDAFKASVSQSDARNFQSTTLGDVRQAAIDIQNIQRERQSLRNMKRIEPFLKGLEKYSEVIGVLCNGTPYLPWIWAPIKLMLQLASEYTDIFEKLILAYQQIGEAMPRFDRLQKTFHDNQGFQNVLSMLYSDILEFHRRAYKFFRRRSWHVVFSSLWNDFAHRFNGILESLRRHCDLVDREASSIDIAEARTARAQAQEDIEKRGEERRERRLQASITWLGIEDRVQEDELYRFAQRRQEKTCDWVLTDTKFTSWLSDDSRESLLWLEGIPGAGKSVICSHIVSFLRVQKGITTAFFFCNSHHDGVNMSSKIIRTAIVQILRAHQELAAHVFEEYATKGLTASMPQIKKLFPELISVILPVRIVIDGLDECPDKDQKCVIKELNSLLTSSNGNCKMIFSSRDCPQIHKALHTKPKISLTQRKPDVNADIQCYVNHVLLDLRKTFDCQIIDGAARRIIDKANGMFLWVRLVISSMEYCHSIQELEDAVQRLPDGLEEAYGQILKRIMNDLNTQDRKKSIRMLEWIACARRTVKVYELEDGMIFQNGQSVLNSRTKPSRDILDLCKPIIEKGPNQSVNFVHYSAKEYLLDVQSGPFLSPREAHYNITLSCVLYLPTSLVLLEAAATEICMQIIQGFHGLYYYASEFWLEHLRHYLSLHGVLDDMLSSALMKLLSFQSRRPAESFEPRSHDSELLNQIIACLSGLKDIPKVQKLAIEILVFRATVSKEEDSQKLLEELISYRLKNDPTLFTQISHKYQQITESILNKSNPVLSTVQPSLIKTFCDIYGSSVIVCRYTRCPYSSDGFDSVQKRKEHERFHEKRLQCVDTACEFFASGFATVTALRNHNRKYHSEKSDQEVPKFRKSGSQAKRFETGTGKTMDKGSSLLTETSLDLQSDMYHDSQQARAYIPEEGNFIFGDTSVQTATPSFDTGFEIAQSFEHTEAVTRSQKEAKLLSESHENHLTQEFDNLQGLDPSSIVDIPEQDVIAKQLWRDRAREAQGQILTLNDVRTIIEDGEKAGIPQSDYFLTKFKLEKEVGEAWDDKVMELMSVEAVYSPQLEALRAQVASDNLPVSADKLAAVDQILDKQREAHRQIISLYERSKDPDISKRPTYTEARETMEGLVMLNSKYEGLLDLEKGMSRHEMWMRKGKKLFGMANAPLHALKIQMQHVLERNLDCFAINTDKLRRPLEPQSREPTPGFGVLEEVFCICRRVESGLMIECRLCHEWYHGKCLKLIQGQIKDDDEYTCPICDWRVKIPRDAARPTIEDLRDWQAEIASLPFQPDEKDILANIIDNAQDFRNHVAPFCHPIMATSEEAELQRFYLRKIEGAEVLLAYETNFFRQELHKWSPIAPEPPPILATLRPTRQPRLTKVQKLTAQGGVDDPNQLIKQPRFKRKSSEQTSMLP